MSLKLIQALNVFVTTSLSYKCVSELVPCPVNTLHVCIYTSFQTCCTSRCFTESISTYIPHPI